MEGGDPRPSVARRLDSVGFVKSRRTEKAKCTFDVEGALVYLGLAGTSMSLAREQCAKYYHDRSKCSAEVTAAIRSLSFVATFLASSVAECADDVHLPIDQAFKAKCAADVSQLVSGLYAVASGGSGMASACVTPHKPFEVNRFSDPRSRFNKNEIEESAHAVYSKAWMNAAGLAWRAAAKGDHRKLRQWTEEQLGKNQALVALG